MLDYGNQSKLYYAFICRMNSLDVDRLSPYYNKQLICKIVVFFFLFKTSVSGGHSYECVAY